MLDNGMLSHAAKSCLMGGFSTIPNNGRLCHAGWEDAALRNHIVLFHLPTASRTLSAISALCTQEKNDTMMPRQVCCQ